MNHRRRQTLTTAAIGAGAALALAACGEGVERADTAVVVPAEPTPEIAAVDPAYPAYDVTTPGATGATAAPGTMGTTAAATPGAMGAPETTGATAATGVAADASARTNAFTDRQLQQFGDASRRLRQEEGGAASAQAATEASTDVNAILREAGLTPEEYIRIAAAAFEDPSLRQRIMQQPALDGAGR